jgi:lactate permease
MNSWSQVFNPFNNVLLSAFVASIPILFIFWALIIKKLKGYIASLLTVALAVIIAIVVYGMPVKLALLSATHGALYGLFPICWIIITAVFLLLSKAGNSRLSGILWPPLLPTGEFRL